MSRLMDKKSNKPKLTEKPLAKVLSYFDSTIKRYITDLHMNSFYRSCFGTPKSQKTPATTAFTFLSPSSKPNDLKRSGILEREKKVKTI